MSDKFILLKKLREETGLGMGDCQVALGEADGNYEKAITLLREKGRVSAAKKSSRITSSGLVGVRVTAKEVVILELACETDFVARGDEFVGLLNSLLNDAINSKTKTVESLILANDGALAKSLTDAIAKIGENIQIKSYYFYELLGRNASFYIHNASAKNPDFGQLASVIIFEGDADKLEDDMKKIAMHAAATNPKAVSIGELDKAFIEEEKRIYTEQAKSSGKPENVIQKMVEGRMSKFYGEVVLLEQPLVMDPDVKVGDFIKHQAEKVGTYVKVVSCVVVKLGTSQQ